MDLGLSYLDANSASGHRPLCANSPHGLFFFFLLASRVAMVDSATLVERISWKARIFIGCHLQVDEVILDS